MEDQIKVGTTCIVMLKPNSLILRILLFYRFWFRDFDFQFTGSEMSPSGQVSLRTQDQESLSGNTTKSAHITKPKCGSSLSSSVRPWVHFMLCTTFYSGTILVFSGGSVRGHHKIRVSASWVVWVLSVRGGHRAASLGKECGIGKANLANRYDNFWFIW